MNFRRFKKANYLLEKIKKEVETDKSITFKCGKQLVRVFYKNVFLKLSCTCKICSLKPEELCSHKIAVLTYLTKKNE